MHKTDLPIPVVQNDLLRLFNWHQLDAPVKEPPCEFVAAGSYSITKTTNGYLTTSPGAGVGLALYDKVAGVGGVAHFLLAKPIVDVKAQQNDFYVAMAMPKFIEALIAAGAQKERLVAALAGGSCLVGNLADDTQVSLGTEVVDAVVSILQYEQVAVAKMEVGGLQPLSLLLDTSSWQASIKLIEAAKDKITVKGIVKPTPNDIEKAIDEAKPIPQIALKLIRLLGSEKKPTFSTLADEIKRDQMLASKILRYSNSPFFSPSKPIDSIERALLFLGEENLLEVAVSTAAGMIYSGQEGGYSLMRGGLYRHALATAHTAKEIAGFSGQIDPGVAYTAGLVHDIGKVVLDRFVATSLSFFYRHNDHVTDFIDLERDLFATDHLVVGQKLANKWQLPDSLSQSICFHHCPEKAPDDNRLLVYIVFLADLLASVYLSGVDMEQINSAGLGERLEVIGLRPNQLPLIIDKISWGKLMYL